MASYLRARRLRGFWYQVDDADSDAATLLYHLGRAATDAAPRHSSLPPLTPEHLAALPAFARRFFGELYERLRAPWALVLDNYESIPATSAVHEVLREALEQIPDGRRAFVMSRAAPPAALARLRVRRQIELLEWPDLRLTTSEARAIATRLASQRLSPAAVRRVHELAGGWVAAMVLLLEQAGRDGLAEDRRNELPEVLFEYLASEIFCREKARTRDVLVQTAFLPRVSGPMAESLTGEPNAGAVLNDLYRRHYFTSRWPGPEPIYEYHPLFRTFLRGQAERELTGSRRRELLTASARLLQETGDLEGAAELWRQAGDSEALARLIEAEGAQLVERARYATLEAWLTGVPASVIEQRPWLLVWRGSARIPFDFATARPDLERSFELFRQRGDPVGMLYTWSLVAQSIASAGQDLALLDPWIQRLDKLAPHVEAVDPGLKLRVAGAATTALTVRQPQHQEAREWAKRTMALVEQVSDVNLRVAGRLQAAVYHLYFGNLSTGRALAEASLVDARSNQVSPILHVYNLILLARYALPSGAPDRALDYVTEAIELSRTTGLVVHLAWSMPDAVSAMLQAGDLDSPLPLLEWLQARSQVASQLNAQAYHYVAGWHALLRCHLDLAAQHADQAVRLGHQAGMPASEAASRLLAVQVRHELGQTEVARRHLALVLDLGGRTGSDLIGFPAWLATARLNLDGNREAEALEALRRAMVIGRAQGYLAVHGWRPPVLARLCAKALEAGIEVDYVRRLVKVGRLVPEQPPVEIEAWPWPIRLFALGRFEVLRDGEILSFSLKAPRRPLDLLKVLIALGGRRVPEVRLMEILWPDADGDAAARALSVNIYRLRGLLGLEGAVRRQAEHVGLDPHLCWVDVWALEKMLDDLADAERSAPRDSDVSPGAAQRLLMALDLHRGGFLAGTAEAVEPWAVSLGDRLRRRLARHAGNLGRLREAEDDLEDAARWYERSLDVSPTAEVTARRLMEVYRRLGRRVDALGVYERHRVALAVTQDVQPSIELRALHAALRTG